MTKVYSADDVSVHNTEKDLWISMHGGVYDLTDFLTKHPGGEEVLLNLAGQDGTVCFDEIGHTEEAIQLRETLKIGTISGGPSTGGASIKRSANREPTVDDDDWVYEGGPKKTSSSSLPIMIAVGALVYAVLGYYFFIS